MRRQDLCCHLLFFCLLSAAPAVLGQAVPRAIPVEEDDARPIPKAIPVDPTALPAKPAAPPKPK